MSTKLLYPQISTSHLLSSTPTIITVIRKQTQKAPSINHPIHKHLAPSRYNFAIKVADQSPSLTDDRKDEDAIETEESPKNHSTISQLKAEINKTLQGINRGIFGIPTEKKSEIEDMVKVLESLNPNPNPTLDLDKFGGCWTLIYSTITILGSKRTKLGLRDFISLGDFLQVIDVAKGTAVNVIKFNVRGLNLLSGKLVIEASFNISSKSVKSP